MQSWSRKRTLHQPASRPRLLSCYFASQIKQLATLMIELYSKLTGSRNGSTKELDGTEYYGKGYEDSDLRIPSMRLVNAQVRALFISVPRCLRSIASLVRVLLF